MYTSTLNIIKKNTSKCKIRMSTCAVQFLPLTIVTVIAVNFPSCSHYGWHFLQQYSVVSFNDSKTFFFNLTKYFHYSNIPFFIQITLMRELLLQIEWFNLNNGLARGPTAGCLGRQIGRGKMGSKLHVRIKYCDRCAKWGRHPKAHEF